MSKPVPPAIRALQSSLRGCTEAPLRERLQEAIRGLERLYNRPANPEPQDNGDLRRQRFVADRHPAPRHIASRTPPDDL